MRLSLLFFLVFFQLFSQQEEKVVRGVVTMNMDPLKDINIIVKSTDSMVLTNKKGEYSIGAKLNDTLIFSYTGMQSAQVIVKNNLDVLNVELQPKIEELDEVIVKKRRVKTQKKLLAEYFINNRLIKTSRGIIDKDRTSFSMRIINGNDLIPIGTDFLYSLQNLYPRMQVDRTVKPSHPISHPRVYLQNWSSGSSPTAIFDVDGVIYQQTPTFVQVADIERVCVLLRNGAIAKYGTEGIGGVIIINMKSNNLMEDKRAKRVYDNSRLRDSIFRILNKPSQK